MAERSASAAGATRRFTALLVVAALTVRSPALATKTAPLNINRDVVTLAVESPRLVATAV
jgi:hypothetical protein